MVNEQNLNKSINELGLSVRSYNCLINAGIKTVGQLVEQSAYDLLRLKNFGLSSLNEVKEVVGSMGLALKP